MLASALGLGCIYKQVGFPLSAVEWEKSALTDVSFSRASDDLTCIQKALRNIAGGGRIVGARNVYCED